MTRGYSMVIRLCAILSVKIYGTDNIFTFSASKKGDLQILISDYITAGGIKHSTISTSRLVANPSYCYLFW